MLKSAPQRQPDRIRNALSDHVTMGRRAAGYSIGGGPKILLADDHDLILEILKHYLETIGGFRVVAVKSLNEVLENLRAHSAFDLVILDYQIPGSNDLEGLMQVIDSSCELPVAILSGVATPEVYERAISLGASGCLPKTMSATAMLNAVHYMLLGGKFPPAGFLNSTSYGVPVTASPALSPREEEVLTALIDGLSDSEIATNLGMKAATVRTCIATILKKFNVTERSSARDIALRLRGNH